MKPAIKKDATYFKKVGGAKTSANKAISELDFNNIDNALTYINEAIEALKSL
jgi:hypothetical protein